MKICLCLTYDYHFGLGHRDNEFWVLQWQYRLWSFKSGDAKLEIFCPKIKTFKGNYWTLRIGAVTSCQKWASF